MRGNTFVRNQPPAEEPDAEMGVAAMFEGATYKTTYNFNDKKIKKCKHDFAEIGDGNKSITFDLPFPQMINGEAKLNASIKLK